MSSVAHDHPHPPETFGPEPALLSLLINGAVHTAPADPATTLVEFLRDALVLLCH